MNWASIVCLPRSATGRQNRTCSIHARLPRTDMVLHSVDQRPCHGRTQADNRAAGYTSRFLT